MNRSTGPPNSLTNTFLNLNVLSSLKLGVPAEVIYFFIVHCLLLPNLSVQERGHVHQVLPSQLTQIISLEFLPVLFGEVAVLLASSDFQFDMDGTIFLMLIAFCGSQGASANLTCLVGPVIIAQAQEIWSALNGPALDFEAFYARYPIPKNYFSNIQHRRIEPHRLLSFHNPVFDGDMSHHEQELAQFKCISLVTLCTGALRAFLRAFRFWLGGGLLVLIHSVWIINIGVWRLGVAGILLPEGPFGEVPDDSVTELFRLLCQGVDCVNRLFSHPEPIGGTGGVLDCLLQSAENHIVHWEAFVLIHE